MFKISGFFDEIHPNLLNQLKAMRTMGVHYLCPRNVNGKNIAQYTAKEFCKEIRPLLLQNGVTVSSIGSPIGKIDLLDEEAYQAQRRQLRELIAIAQEMGCSYLRIFSFYTAKAAAKGVNIHEMVVEKLGGFLREAEGSGVILMHENEKRIYGEAPTQILALYRSLNHPQFALCYDASNYIQCGVDPWEAYQSTKHYTVYYHMKDCTEGIEVPLGTGQGRIAEILSDLNHAGYDGFLTLEPHALQYILLKRIFYLLPFLHGTRRGRVFRQTDGGLGIRPLQAVSREQAFQRQYQNLVAMIQEIGGQYA